MAPLPHNTTHTHTRSRKRSNWLRVKARWKHCDCSAMLHCPHSGFNLLIVLIGVDSEVPTRGDNNGFVAADFKRTIVTERERRKRRRNNKACWITNYLKLNNNVAKFVIYVIIATTSTKKYRLLSFFSPPLRIVCDHVICSVMIPEECEGCEKRIKNRSFQIIRDLTNSDK